MKPKDYLVFEERVIQTTAGYTRKTKTWLVKNKISGELLGVVLWRPGWRKYVMRFVHSSVDFDAGCLNQVKEFLDNQMKEYKDAKAKKTKGSTSSKGTRVQRKIPC